MAEENDEGVARDFVVQNEQPPGGDSADGSSTNDGEPDDTELTYAAAGVDIAESDRATAALISAVNGVTGDYAGLLDIGDRYLGLTTDGVGTKAMVAAAVNEYTSIGIDCVAMSANDLVAAGIDPVGFVDYLAVEEPSDRVAEAIGEGLAEGCDRAGVELIAGETAVMPEVVDGFDLAGTCAGLASKEAPFPGTVQPGDALVGWPSSGIHSNGLTLARKAITREYDYDEPYPPDPGKTIGEVLLTPTRIYTDLLSPLRSYDVRGAVHITGGGWRNLERLGEYQYDVRNPFSVPRIFEFIADTGNVHRGELYRTFNMGLGFVAAVAPDRVADLTQDANGQVIGEVTDGDSVVVDGLEL